MSSRTFLGWASRFHRDDSLSVGELSHLGLILGNSPVAFWGKQRKTGVCCFTYLGKPRESRRHPLGVNRKEPTRGKADPATTQTRTPRRKKNTDYRDVEHLEESQVKALIKAAGEVGRNRNRDRAMVLLAFHHGLRCTELVRMKWERVDLDKEDIWIVRVKGSKSGKHPLYPDDIAALKKLGPAESGWVFKAESKKGTGHVSESGFQKIVARAGERAGIKCPVHPHMLRHTCGFWLRKQRHDLLDIRDWLGHVSVKNTEIYAAAGPDRFREIGLGRKRKDA